MTLGLLLASALAGAAYKLAPGPAVLALLGIGASRGRRAGAVFICGNSVGDVVWASLSLTAVIGGRTIGPLSFDVLGLICGIYLCWLGFRSVTAGRSAEAMLTTEPRGPLLRGMAFGLLNPKAYPVAVAMFTALLARYASALNWRAFAPLLAAACVGFLVADGILITLVGAGAVRRFYRRHALWVTRASGALFVAFGLHAITTAGPGIWRPR